MDGLGDASVEREGLLSFVLQALVSATLGRLDRSLPDGTLLNRKHAACGGGFVGSVERCLSRRGSGVGGSLGSLTAGGCSLSGCQGLTLTHGSAPGVGG